MPNQKQSHYAGMICSKSHLRQKTISVDEFLQKPRVDGEQVLMGRQGLQLVTKKLWV